ncbi:CpsD/CapB family tyrosine-protein kinase [Paenibacillus silviterrae]|uniref:CpsD/CapB family tyrosine-protein kinase n=1 Tax=Paenibacillus silviterrae TaxID=3242194 RepID=UPI002543E754|nr:CpsD/CapB family tyrosine-protein kinase [Paenibacillus chinjuensis]
MSQASNRVLPQQGALLHEEFLTLRVNIEFATAGESVQTIAFTSSRRGEGRSTNARQLAVAFASSGKRTVLVDADLRVSTPYGDFGREASGGLSAYLSNTCELEQAIEPTAVNGLDIIKSGPIAQNASELLASTRMEQLLAQLKQSYDMVIVDGPPLSFIDGKVLAAKCDGVVLVLEFGRVTRATAKQIQEQLTQIHARLLGTVLNKSKETV